MKFLLLILCLAPTFCRSQLNDDWQWRQRTTTNAPSPRTGAGFVWTGKELLVSHGYDGDDKGGRYDPAHDIWRPMATNNAPSARSYQTVIWTGKRLIVWGGFGYGSPYGTVGPLNDGGIYDPETDAWKPTSLDAAPSHRHDHIAVWTGSEMIIWGGRRNTTKLGDGGRYNPETDTWTAMTTEGAPTRRHNHGAVWTGIEMIVWSGDYIGGPGRAGGRYNPKTDSWTPTSLTGAPANRYNFASVWSGSEMLVWGGAEGGGCYNPVTDSWRAMNTNGMPATRAHLSTAWSGKEMIVWGGQDGSNTLRDDGGRYDPLTDTWLPTTTNGTPAGRHEATAVWIGDAMLLFGGWTGGPFYVNDLWSYQPSDIFSGDGLPDDWQQMYFGPSWTEDALLYSDPDEDGQPNHYELITGTNPTNSLSRFTVTLELDGNYHPKLKLSGLALNRKLSVHWSTNISNPIFQPVNTFQIETQNQSIIVTDLEGVSGTRFYKVQLQR